MSSYQKTIIKGKLGSMPELRTTTTGQDVANFSVAINERFNRSAGEGQQPETVERVIWYRITAWGNLALSVAKYLVTGSDVLVEGTLMPDPETGHPRIWVGRDQIARASYELRADRVIFNDTKAETDAKRAELAASGQPTSAEPVALQETPEDEIPF